MIVVKHGLVPQGSWNSRVPSRAPQGNMLHDYPEE